MKLFECQNCGEQLYFENTKCETCHSALGYLSEYEKLSSLQANGETWRARAEPNGRYRYCTNYNYKVCNWLVSADDNASLCDACQLNRTIPNLNVPEHRQYWQQLELAKHRLVYSLKRLRLPLQSKAQDPTHGIAFEFLSDEPTFRENEQIMTGHAEGIITINIAEANPAKREQFRTNMAEPYRTLLGHFRHEIGHCYWERLVRSDPETLASFRRLFGDESIDYNRALEAHYAEGPPSNWNDSFVSAYAAAHPWEDWAESWAHYLHIVDTLETAYAFGIHLNPNAGQEELVSGSAQFDPYQQNNFDIIIKSWFPIAYAVNSLNRSMGQPDLYPFVLSPTTLSKIQFVHERIKRHGLAFQS